MVIIKLEVIKMDNSNLKSGNSLEYANLPDSQRNRLVEMEKQFNNEFGTDYYVMVMKKS